MNFRSVFDFHLAGKKLSHATGSCLNRLFDISALFNVEGVPVNFGVRIINGETRGGVGNLPHAKNAKPPRGSLSSDLILTFFVPLCLRVSQLIRFV